MHPAPRPTPSPRPTQAEQNRAWIEQIERVKFKLLGMMERIADRHAAHYADMAADDAAAPVDVQRREMANAMKVWRVCARKTCRRTQACRGEPAHCLQACFPALPHGTFEAYVAESRRRRKR